MEKKYISSGVVPITGLIATIIFDIISVVAFSLIYIVINKIIPNIWFAAITAGLFGFGYGNSRQKFLYLPEPQNDFIFSILLEESGFIGGFIIVLAFLTFFSTSFSMAARAKTRERQLMIIGFTSLLAVQTFLNMGVVTGLLPVTGVTLPFISYGGSSLVMTWGIIGIILNLAQETEKEGRR